VNVLLQDIVMCLGARRRGRRHPPPGQAKRNQVARIPIGGTVESLNVSVSAALCLYETVRQRGV
jgi:tRNA(Leu) C34 or U34 (ribose-2'-O)-methylase TrmL